MRGTVLRVGSIESGRYVAHQVGWRQYLGVPSPGEDPRRDLIASTDLHHHDNSSVGMRDDGLTRMPCAFFEKVCDPLRETNSYLLSRLIDQPKAMVILWKTMFGRYDKPFFGKYGPEYSFNGKGPERSGLM
jgi:hypothetical protein